MCTVSWIRESGRYQIFSNRDEKLSRRPSTRPQIHSREGVRYIAPLDGDWGGTWLAANEYGVSICLLNGRPGSPRTTVSRGLLVLDLIAARSIREAVARFARKNLMAFAPFTIAVLDPDSPITLLSWDGSDCAAVVDNSQHGVLSSSSFDYEGVQASRREQFARLRARYGRLQAGHLLDFHRSHSPECGAYSACMHRGDAATLSFSWLTVSRDRVELYHSAGAPCSSLAGESASLEMRALGMAA